MATSIEEIRAAFGEHLAFLVRSLDEGSDLHAAIATGLEALQAGSLSSLRPTKPDTQLVELAGRSWLASQLMRAGIEIARPERDRGIDLIAYVDKDVRIGNFIACPIQMKAATSAVFSLDPQYVKFPGLVLAYVWNLGNPSSTTCFALTYREALGVARKMGYTRTASWLTGGSTGKRGYSTTRPSERLRGLLAI